MVAESVLQGIDDWLGQIVQLCGGAEAAIDLERDTDSPHVVLNQVARGAQDTGAQGVLADRDVRVKVVAQIAQVASLGIFVKD